MVIDETPESEVALAYAAARAARTQARVRLLHVLPAVDFVQWGAVQQAIEAEARAAGEALLARAAAAIAAQTGAAPETALAVGETRAQVLAVVEDDPALAGLVLAAAAKGPPGPLVAFFTGERAGALPCPVIIVPGGLDARAIADLA